MGIKIEFNSNCSHYTDEIKKANNELVKSCINEFGGETDLLQESNLLIYYDNKSVHSLRGKSGNFIPKKSYRYKYEEFRSYLSQKVPNFLLYDIIQLAIEIAAKNNEVFKILTIAHELQHALQLSHNENLLFRDEVLRNYLEYKNIWSKDLYREHPIEKEAFKRAKKIAVSLFGENKVDGYLKNDINKSLYNNEKSYYDWERKAESYYMNYKEEMNAEYRNLKSNNINNLSENAKFFLESYEHHKEYMQSK